MTKDEVEKKTLQEQLKFAQRASILIKTPQYKELQKIMMNEMARYNNYIVRHTPLSHEEYLLNLGKLLGLKDFVNNLVNSAEKKDEYARKLERYE